MQKLYDASVTSPTWLPLQGILPFAWTQWPESTKWSAWTVKPKARTADAISSGVDVVGVTMVRFYSEVQAKEVSILLGFNQRISLVGGGEGQGIIRSNAIMSTRSLLREHETRSNILSPSHLEAWLALVLGRPRTANLPTQMTDFTHTTHILQGTVETHQHPTLLEKAIDVYQPHHSE